MQIKKYNPENVAPPVGQYSHVTVIPKNAELVVLSGQIGSEQDGTLPDDIESQFANALGNIKKILEAENVNIENVFKINFWLTEEIDRQSFLNTWQEFHLGSLPATTYAYVNALAKPEIKVEVEAWAAK